MVQEKTILEKKDRLAAAYIAKPPLAMINPAMVVDKIAGRSPLLADSQISLASDLVNWVSW